MNTETFLAAVVAPGNYLVISYNKEPWTKNARAWSSRAFNGTQYAEAAGFAQWCSNKGFDTYFALASFRLAETSNEPDKRGNQKLYAKREQANVQAIRTLVIDLDVKRDGDGKNPSEVFATRNDALRWLTDFCSKIGFPKPSLLIDSGYGFHIYWLLDTSLPPAQWQPLADALKNAMLANGFVGDRSPTIDCARILRPPGVRNYKGAQGNAGVPVAAFTQFTGQTYALAKIQTVLTPWMTAQAAVTAQATHLGSVSPLGPKPGWIAAQPAPGANQAAQAGVTNRDYLFANVAHNCAQVGQSLAVQGKGDSYQLWYLGHLTLAHFCSDGADYVHEISKGDPRYTPAETDAAVARISKEVLSSTGLGAPKCTSFNEYRRGVCSSCPHWGKINSPVNLGTPDGDLPNHYRRIHNRLEYWSKDKSGDEVWRPLVAGNVYGPRLEELTTGGFVLTFTYELAGSEHYVRAPGGEMGQPVQVMAALERQGVPLDRKIAGPFGDFVVAWITKLRQHRAQKGELYRPFGWCFNRDGNRIGLAIAGTLYRMDGSIDAVPGGDAKLNSFYRPMGSLANWRKAAALFEGPTGRVDLQCILAISFGSPLIGLTGDVRGMSWNFWSVGTGIGKSSMMKVAQAVWGDQRALSSHDDTPNAVMRTLSAPRIMPRLWDEMRLKHGQEESFSSLIYNIPQGREKARMGPDTNLRDIGEWETMVVFTANRSLMDYVTDQTEGTDSGMARLFEVHLPQGHIDFDAAAGPALKHLETNFGHAGREFAAYVATHFDTVQATITKLVDALAKQLQIRSGERFYVAGMVAAIVAASIAKQLKLFDFDVAALHAWLVQEFYKLRRAREGHSTSANGEIDIEQVLSSYCYGCMDYRLITATFSPLGKETKVIQHPRFSEIRYQISTGDAAMRVERGHFRDWLRGKKLAANQILGHMADAWGARQAKLTLGAGTPYHGGQVWVVEIPLTSPALAAHLPTPGKETKDGSVDPAGVAVAGGAPGAV